MFTTYQVLTLLLVFTATLISVWGVVAKAQKEMKAELRTSIEEMKVAHAKSVDESRAQFTSINESFGKIALQINTILEGDVRELQNRVNRLETGQDEWTKTLRGRSHDHASMLTELQLKVDRLERPDRYPRSTGGA